MAEYNAQPERDIRFHISCGALGTKGIHLRSGVQDKPRDISITVEPRFLYPQKTGLLNENLNEKQKLIFFLISPMGAITRQVKVFGVT